MIFDGREYATKRELDLRDKLLKLSEKISITSILVGDDPASVLYSKMKKSKAEELGISFKLIEMGNDVAPEEIIGKIRNDDSDGTMIQLPLPESLRNNTEEIIASIEPDKDVDGLNWEKSAVMPATVRAVISIMDEINSMVKDLWQREMVLVGVSGNVGRPLRYFLNKRGAYVIGVKSDTHDKDELIKRAGVVISTVGKAGIIESDLISENQVVVDVGIDKKDGKIAGDFEAGVYNRALVAVPVPGGVGPVTVISLMENLYELYKLTRKI